MSYNRVISDTSLRLGPVRFSYAYVFKPRTGEDGKPGKYGVCVLLPKSDVEARKMFETAYNNACALGKANKWNGKIPSTVTLPLRDGDDEHPDDPAFANCWFFNANSSNAPGVRVRENGVMFEALDDGDFYSGCYGAVTINLFAYNSNGNKGVAVGLNNVIKTDDGERLAGGRSADADFADMVD